jgi:hypothetical protein
MRHVLGALLLLAAGACAGCTHQWFRQRPTPRNFVADTMEGTASVALGPCMLLFGATEGLRPRPAPSADGAPTRPSLLTQVADLVEGAAGMAGAVTILPAMLAFELAVALHQEPRPGRRRIRSRGGFDAPEWVATPEEKRERDALPRY